MGAKRKSCGAQKCCVNTGSERLIFYYLWGQVDGVAAGREGQILSRLRLCNSECLLKLGVGGQSSSSHSSGSEQLTALLYMGAYSLDYPR